MSPWPPCGDSRLSFGVGWIDLDLFASGVVGSNDIDGSGGEKSIGVGERDAAGVSGLLSVDPVRYPEFPERFCLNFGEREPTGVNGLLSVDRGSSE